MAESTNFELEEKFLTADRLISESRISEAAHLLEEILAEGSGFWKSAQSPGMAV